MRAPMPSDFKSAGIGDFDVFDFEREGKRPDGIDREGRVLARLRGRSQAPMPGSSPASSTIRRISGTRRSRPTPIRSPASPASCSSPTTPPTTTFSCPPSPACATSRRHRPASRSRRRAAKSRSWTRRHSGCITRPSRRISPRGMRLAAIRFEAGDRAALRSAFAQAGIAASEHMGKLVVGAAATARRWCSRRPGRRNPIR